MEPNDGRGKDDGKTTTCGNGNCDAVIDILELAKQKRVLMGLRTIEETVDEREERIMNTPSAWEGDPDYD